MSITIDKAKILKWLRKKVPHYECEDCWWYSCAKLCSDEDKCDCGADKENAMRAAITALIDRRNDEPLF